MRRTSVFAAGENLGAGGIHFRRACFSSLREPIRPLANGRPGTQAGLPAQPWTASGSPRPWLPNKHIFYIKTPFWRIITPEWGLLWSFTISYDTVKVQFCRKVRDFEAMARKKVETNISFDEMRQKYYVCMDYGLDETGKRVKKYKTYPRWPRPAGACAIFRRNRTPTRPWPPAP